jgi:hypothetical protein
VLAAFGDLSSNAASEFVSMNGAPPDLPPFDECVPRQATGAVPTALMNRLLVRLHPDHTGWLRGERSGTGEMAGWFSFADGRPLDTLSLLLDRRCTAAGGVQPRHPVGLGAHGRADGARASHTGTRARCSCLFRTRFVHGGMFEEDGEVWDSTGHARRPEPSAGAAAALSGGPLHPALSGERTRCRR